MIRRLASLLFLISVASAVNKPNIILVMTDDQGYGPVGKRGNPWIKTPNLDALYDQSTRLTRFLVSPTRSALMTGRHRHASPLVL
jgi:arylsulfatase A-like enzyme